MTEKEKQNKRVVKQKLNDTQFTIGMLIVLGISIPFLYYANQIYNYAHENKPKGYKYAEYKQLWMTAVGAASFTVMRELIMCVSQPIFSKLIPIQGGDKDAQARVVKKACNNLVLGLYFLSSAVWGYHILGNSTWLPWFMFGQNPSAQATTCF